MMKIYFGCFVIIFIATTISVSGLCPKFVDQALNRITYNPNPKPPLSRQLKEECTKKGEIAGRGPDYGCDITCESLTNSNSQICTLMLKNRCFCPKGMLRTTINGKCITKYQCPGVKGKNY